MPRQGWFILLEAFTQARVTTIGYLGVCGRFRGKATAL